MLRRDFLKYLSTIPFVGSLFTTEQSGASEGQPEATQEDVDKLLGRINRGKWSSHSPRYMWMSKGCMDRFKKANVLPKGIEFDKNYGGMIIIEVEEDAKT